MGSEQRRHPRVDTDVPVVIQGDDGAHAGSLRNVSASGAAIEFNVSLGRTEVAFDIGSSVEMSHPGPEPVRGTIVRSYAGGIAMHFEESDDDLLKRVSEAARDIGDRR